VNQPPCDFCGIPATLVLYRDGRMFCPVCTEHLAEKHHEDEWTSWWPRSSGSHLAGEHEDQPYLRRSGDDLIMITTDLG